MWTLLRIALRNVLRNRRRTLITLAAVFVGVGVMVCIQGILNGLQQALVSGVVNGQVGAIQIHRKGYLRNVLSSPLNLDFALDAALLDKVAAVPGVKAVAPRIVFPAMINAGEETLFLQATGVDPAREFLVCPERQLAFTPGATFGAGPPPRQQDAKAEDPPPIDDGVVLSDAVAEGIGAQRGTLGALLAPDQDGSLSGENIHVAGLTTVSMPGAESRVAVVPLQFAQRLLRMEGRVTELAVAVDDLEQASTVAAAIQAQLGPTFEVHTWDRIAIFVKDIRAREDIVVNVISVVFMILMLLGMANTMLMTVLERTREIGTMLSLGVTRRAITTMFLFEALALGVTGSTIGATVGTVIILGMHTTGIVLHMPGQIVPFTIHPFLTVRYLVFVVALAAVGAVIFARYPAARAGRLRPVEALAGQ